jgi:anaerobic selenocysteine-containing dehydrogenase
VFQFSVCWSSKAPATHHRPITTAAGHNNFGVRAKSVSQDRKRGLMTMPTEHPSVCTFDCPDTCSLTVTVDDGEVIKVRGSKALPFTDGVICNKVAHASYEFNHGSGRLRFPLLRTGPRGSGDSSG